MAAIRSGHDVLSSAPPGAGSSTGALLAMLTQLLSIPRWVLGGGVKLPIGVRGALVCRAAGGARSIEHLLGTGLRIHNVRPPEASPQWGRLQLKGCAVLSMYACVC